MFAFVAFVVAVLDLSAQENSSAFILAKDGVVVDYAISAKLAMSKKSKLVGYGRLTVSNIVEHDGKTEILYTFLGLDTKKKPLAFNSEFQPKIILEDGAIRYDIDPLMNGGGYITAHEGFAFVIPATLNVGDNVETGVVKERVQFPMSPEVENIIRYEEFTVCSEEDIATEAGIYHCYKLEGVLNGTFQTVPLKNTKYAIWFSRKIGIVKIETDYYSESVIIDNVAGF